MMTNPIIKDSVASIWIILKFVTPYNLKTFNSSLSILSIKKKLNEILANHSGQKVDKIAKDSDRDNFMSPDEAVKYGLIDAVVDSRTD